MFDFGTSEQHLRYYEYKGWEEAEDDEGELQEYQEGGRVVFQEGGRVVQEYHPGRSIKRVPPAGTGSSTSLVVLPCPGDPLVFMEYIWGKDNEVAVGCLALPMVIGNRTNKVALLPEDVDFLWEKAEELRRQGYANMGRYFGKCKGHPLADQAKRLYWQTWTGYNSDKEGWTMEEN